MSVDLSKLSSKELYELAKQREKEEQEANLRLERLKAVSKQREECIAQHKDALADTDAAIRELQKKREKQVSDYEATLAPLEREIEELKSQIKADEAKAQALAAPPQRDPSKPPLQAAVMAPAKDPSPVVEPKPESATVSKPTPAGGSSDIYTLYDLIRGMMRQRTYVSESLMKEKLKTAGYDMSNLRKQLEQLVSEKRLEKKGSGNYALGRRK